MVSWLVDLYLPSLQLVGTPPPRKLLMEIGLLMAWFSAKQTMLRIATGKIRRPNLSRYIL